MQSNPAASSPPFSCSPRNPSRRHGSPPGFGLRPLLDRVARAWRELVGKAWVSHGGGARGEGQAAAVWRRPAHGLGREARGKATVAMEEGGKVAEQRPFGGSLLCPERRRRHRDARGGRAVCGDSSDGMASLLSSTTCIFFPFILQLSTLMFSCLSLSNGFVYF
jgi:hypothetical protein